MDCQFIYNHGKFMTSQTVSFSPVDINAILASWVVYECQPTNCREFLDIFASCLRCAFS